jgi:pimeloyl-ACP methyl ester carboxylesterase
VADVPETRYAKAAAGGHVAHQVVGSGAIDVLVVDPMFPVDFIWDEPRFVYFLNRLSSFCRHIWFDQRGTGASDGITHADARLAESFVDDMVAVLDAVDVERVAVLDLAGLSVGLLFAATHPDRTTALVVFNGFARWRRAEDYLEGVADGEFDAQIRRARQPGATPVEIVAPSLADDARFRRWAERAWRLSTPPEERLWRVRNLFDGDLRDVLGSIRVPTLVINRRDRPTTAALTRFVADHIEGARYVELPGSDALPFVGDADAVLDAIEEFLTGHLAPPPVDRVLATILFTDLVNSTPKAAELGDRRWREVIATHDALVSEEVDRFRGRLVRFTGDGVLATFDGPARAIRCACAIRDSLQALGLEVRAGLHTGEIELLGVVPGHVADAGDGRAADGGVVAVMVVAVQPGGQAAGSLAF